VHLNIYQKKGILMDGFSEECMGTRLSKHERREFSRVERECPMAVFILSDFDDSCIEHANQGYSIDIGQGGVQVCTFRSVPEGSTVKVELKCKGDHAPITIRGRVAWSIPINAHKNCRMGVEFLDPSDENLFPIMQMMNSCPS
jgi:hypothetical protein